MENVEAVRFLMFLLLCFKRKLLVYLGFLSVCVYIYVCRSVSVGLCMSLSVCFFPLYFHSVSLCLWLCLCICLSVYLCLFLPVSLSATFCLSILSAFNM